MSQTPPNAPADRRARRSQQALLDALVQLMIEKGFEQTTIADIAERANVGRSTFYAHFADKEALLRQSLQGLRAYLTEAGASRPDLILLDMMMPIMDGVAFREQQQRHPELASIPILIFTAFSAPADTSWAAGHLSKPLRLDALLATIARHLA